MKYQVRIENTKKNIQIFDTRADAIVELKRWFESDASADDGDDIVADNDVRIKTADGQIYTVAEKNEVLERTGSFAGGKYVYPYGFDSYTDAKGRNVSIVEVK